MGKKRCFLSGLEIPQGKLSKEHLAPKSKLPYKIASLPYNIVPAIKIFNNIKGDLFLCEWEKVKYDLCFTALGWNLKFADRKLVEKALADGMPKINPCKYCICMFYQEYCVKNR